MKIYVTGANGMLGRALCRVAVEESIDVVPLSHEALDVTDERAIASFCARGMILINCAGIVRGRPEPPEQYLRVNAVAPHVLARHVGRLVQVSTDCVFSGNLRSYDEYTSPSPIDIYGLSKQAGEVQYGPHLTLRLSFIGLGQRGLMNWLLSQQVGARVQGYQNWDWSGLSAYRAARAILAAAPRGDVTGLLHLEGERLSKYELLRLAAHYIRPDIQVVPTAAPEDRCLVLRTTRTDVELPRVPSWDQMMKELADDYSHDPGGPESGVPPVPPRVSGERPGPVGSAI